MRSARLVLATATATAALVIAAPAAYADHSGDWEKDKSSSTSKEYDKDSESKHDKEYDKGSKHDKHGKYKKPEGGMHTGGGALAAVTDGDWGSAKDPKYDPETYKDKNKGDSQSEESWSGKDKGEKNKDWKHEKPRGGMHTGGGALADPGVSAGGLAALAVLGTGAYALRRKKASGSVA
ncbi:hypothetical protein G3I38_00990 [Streptomyces sp. SID7958]|uniref:LPXTG cell wall anchor domain-containing protein n=2 Tax=unclassified Streptomyces TaxID=2593676 RepID=A0A6G3R5D6_9ACTN|nr:MULTISPECIES: hypothetical protein [unclassified Streptomyces]NEA90684.1 hypothetical protein [Streptomyces sp. SID14436]NEC77851.1 hypothetical protein [Streptomyces sp. SID7958]